MQHRLPHDSATGTVCQLNILKQMKETVNKYTNVTKFYYVLVDLGPGVLNAQLMNLNSTKR